jgi:tetratricopeptide (TPR) repeat protein
MSRCIHYSPKNSALYSNRALFHSQLGNIDAAVDDLVNAINYNYLNYVAYFNLFSLQFNAGQIFPAFDNLCCSLSCLYLVRARKARRELDVQRSIKYAENNPEAHILKALMYLEDGKNKLALNEI